MSSDLPERFWAKVDTSGECWIWTACRNAKGDDCGQFRIDGKLQYPQRLVFIDAGGEVPDGHVVRRDCGTKLCVRPGPGHVRFARPADCLAGEPLSDRFWSKVNKNGPTPSGAPHLGPCWEWTRRIDDEGYGRLTARGESRRVHVLSYEDSCGEVPPGLHVDHECWNRKCVRPDHLRAVSPQWNAQNLQGANRRSQTGIRGVYPYPDGEGYIAQARRDGRTQHLGVFADVDSAEAAVTRFRREHYPGSLMDQREEAA